MNWKLRPDTLKRKTIVQINDINVYRAQKNSVDAALLNVIDEKDRVAYPEERVSTVKSYITKTVFPSR